MTDTQNKKLSNNLNNSRPSWRKNLGHYFSEYCNSTSVHGIQYLGERGRLLIEKLVWSVIIATVWCVCFYLIGKAYNKWMISPVVVTFTTTETPISQIPFPAITIYPLHNSDPNIFNFTDVALKMAFGKKITDEEYRYFEIFSMACETNNFLNITNRFATKNYIMNIEELDYLFKALPSFECNHYLPNWQGIYSNLSLTITSNGLAHSFNMLDYSDIFNTNSNSYANKLRHGLQLKGWTFDDGYTLLDSSLETFPRRGYKSGINGGFAVVAMACTEFSKYSCNIPFSGYEVVLHHPSELPNLNKEFYLPLGSIVSIAVIPRMISISENLKTYSPEARKCFLTSERNLYFFKSYTQENCQHECLVNYTRSSCGCIPFYMLGYNNLPTCGLKSLACLKVAEERYNSIRNISDCNCLPSCTSLKYDIEISQTSWDYRNYLNLWAELNSFNISSRNKTKELSFSSLHVYYKETQFLTLQRNELYGIVDFFSNTGGLLGLFIGFSVTSVFEILYFLTLRLVCNLKIFGKIFSARASQEKT